MSAAAHASLLSFMKRFPSSDPIHAMIASLSRGASGAARCIARPRKPESHPTPTAPGPNWSQWSSTCAMCSRENRVRPSPSGVSRTSIQLTPPPNSHVAANDRGLSQAVIVPPAFPSNWYFPPSRSSPETGRNQRSMRSATVTTSHMSSMSVS